MRTECGGAGPRASSYAAGPALCAVHPAGGWGVQWRGGDSLKTKFLVSLGLAGVWLVVSLHLAVGWVRAVGGALPPLYLCWVIGGVALLPGFLMSTMFFSNLLHRRLPCHPHTDEPVTVILCARNEEANIPLAIRALRRQRYAGPIHVLAVDNGSTDGTRRAILAQQAAGGPGCTVEYVFCAEPGKAHALNAGLARVRTPHFLTVDADTRLEENAVQRIMDHIVAQNSACAAGNLFAANGRGSLAARMQNYDYLLSIAAIKRFQGSYRSTLVAQGAFSAYNTAEVRAVGGWQDVMGEDIVLTYSLLEKGLPSTYEPRAVGYTHVPETAAALYSQRRRWAVGMIEGLAAVRPWRQGTAYARYFTSVNLAVIWLDLAFLFGFLPGVLLAVCGYFYLVGLLTLFTVAVCIVLYASMYRYQKRLGVPFLNSLTGFLAFLVAFQAIQSTAALHGYLTRILHRKGEWK